MTPPQDQDRERIRHRYELAWDRGDVDKITKYLVTGKR